MSDSSLYFKSNTGVDGIPTVRHLYRRTHNLGGTSYTFILTLPHGIAHTLENDNGEILLKFIRSDTDIRWEFIVIKRGDGKIHSAEISNEKAEALLSFTDTIPVTVHKSDFLERDLTVLNMEISDLKTRLHKLMETRLEKKEQLKSVEMNDMMRDGRII